MPAPVGACCKAIGDQVRGFFREEGIKHIWRSEGLGC